MALFRIIAVSLIFLLLNSDAFSSGNDRKGKKDKKIVRDTTTAFVMYGHHLLLGSKWEKYSRYFDLGIQEIPSEEELTPEIAEALRLSRDLATKTPEQLHYLIDSLFDLEVIPYQLINEINFQIAFIDRKKPESQFDHMVSYDDSKYPANIYYKNWNTIDPVPYGKNLSVGDDEIMVMLTDPKNHCDFHMPFEGVITSKFGWRDGRTHHGYDIDLEVWDPVHASFSGVVRMAKYWGNYGRLVVIRHHNGLETFYAHLHRFKVQPGDIVEAGDVIGLGGSSGRSTGSHLHFEIRFKGIAIDPSHIISFEENQLHADTIILDRTTWGYNVKPKGVLLHYVEKGESLSKISNIYGIEIEDLCVNNGLRKNAYLRKGQRIMIKYEKTRNDISSNTSL